MNRICLDTSAYSQFMRGHPQAVALVTGARTVGVPAVVLGELRTGFRLGSRCARNEAELQMFLDDPVVEVWGVEAEAARQYADIVVALRAAGRPLPTNDVWIAAVAAREGAIVVTHDDHFRAIQRVGSVILPA